MYYMVLFFVSSRCWSFEFFVYCIEVVGGLGICSGGNVFSIIKVLDLFWLKRN